MKPALFVFWAVLNLAGWQEPGFAMEKTPPQSCSYCHDEKMSTEKISQDTSQRRAHWDIRLNHAEEGAMDCRTCHVPGRVNLLRRNEERFVSFDQAHQSCARCHFKEVRDWEGGAHGKRLGRWDQKSAAKCSSCHDPHRPALKTRWPVAYPKIPRGGKKNE